MILITGGLGFIGAHTACQLISDGQTVAVTRHRRWELPPVLETHARRLRVVDIDLNDDGAVTRAIEAVKPERVIHLSTAHWDTASFGAEFRTNVAALACLLEACAAAQVQRVLLASSIAVYANAATRPFRESDPLDTESPAPGPAVWKRLEEQLGHYFAQRNPEVQVCRARIGSAYGPGYRSMRSLISRVAVAVAQQRPIQGPIAVEYPDFVHVEDVATGLARLCQTTGIRPTVVNLGAGIGLDRDELSDLAAHVGLPAAEVHRLRSAPAWNKDNYMDASLARRELDHQPRPLEEGLVAYVRYLEESRF
jgi:UDP-glucose 4-epimerase